LYDLVIYVYEDEEEETSARSAENRNKSHYTLKSNTKVYNEKGELIEELFNEELFINPD